MFLSCFNMPKIQVLAIGKFQKPSLPPTLQLRPLMDAKGYESAMCHRPVVHSTIHVLPQACNKHCFSAINSGTCWGLKAENTDLPNRLHTPHFKSSTSVVLMSHFVMKERKSKELCSLSNIGQNPLNKQCSCQDRFFPPLSLQCKIIYLNMTYIFKNLNRVQE